MLVFNASLGSQYTVFNPGKTLQACRNRRFQDQSLVEGYSYQSIIQIWRRRTAGYRDRSLEGVHSYKRTSDDQRKTLSDIINRTETAPTIALQPKSNGDSAAIASSVSSAPSVSQCSGKQTTLLSSQSHQLSGVNMSGTNFTVNFYLDSLNAKLSCGRKWPMVIYSNSD